MENKFYQGRFETLISKLTKTFQNSSDSQVVVLRPLEEKGEKIQLKQKKKPNAYRYRTATAIPPSFLSPQVCTSGFLYFNFSQLPKLASTSLARMLVKISVCKCTEVTGWKKPKSECLLILIPSAICILSEEKTQSLCKTWIFIKCSEVYEVVYWSNTATEDDSLHLSQKLGLQSRLATCTSDTVGAGRKTGTSGEQVQLL